MSPNNKSQEQIVQETYDKVNQIWQAFFGVKNTDDNGLLGAFKAHCEDDKCFRADYYKFKRLGIGIFFFLVGSGVLGLGIFKIILGN